MEGGGLRTGIVKSILALLASALRELWDPPCELQANTPVSEFINDVLPRLPWHRRCCSTPENVSLLQSWTLQLPEGSGGRASAFAEG